MVNKISTEPGFHWWVRHVLRKHDITIKKVESGYLRKTSKYGIEIPDDITSTIQLDTDNNNSL